MMTKALCPYCSKPIKSLSRHIKAHHPAEYKTQEDLILSLWSEGISSRKISERDDVIFSGGTSIIRVLRNHLTQEELEFGRRKMIGDDVKSSYASGSREWVTKINVARNQSEESRRKNSKGVKRAYNDGRKVVWSEGKTALTDYKVRQMADKLSRVMKDKYDKGLLPNVYLPGKFAPNWQGGKSKDNEKVRAYKHFSKGDRKEIIRRAGNCCEFCGKSYLDLRFERSMLNIRRWNLECDHKIPLVAGGEKSLDNGQALCTECHLVKSLNERGIDSGRIKAKYNLVNQRVFNNVLGNSASLIDLSVQYGKRAILEMEGISFFSDEWRQKRGICKSIVKAKSGIITNRIFARKCLVSLVTKEEEIIFTNNNHISGFTHSELCLGLSFDNELISIISFRKPFTKVESRTIEIARFCSMLDTIVVGGLSKLISASKALLEGSYDKMMTYADLRFGDGNGYLRTGFELIGRTRQDYFYTDGYNRFGRFKYRAKDGKSERDIAIKSNVYKVYGRGSNKYERSII